MADRPEDQHTAAEDAVGVSADEATTPVSNEPYVPVAEEPPAAATAMFRVPIPAAEPAPASDAPQAPVMAAEPEPEVGATAMFRVPIPAPEPEPPVAATAMFRVPIPAPEPEPPVAATAMFRVPIPAPEPEPPVAATAMFRVPIPAPEPEPPVAATAMFRVPVAAEAIAAPVDPMPPAAVEDLQSTSVYRLQTPMPAAAPVPMDDGATNVYRLQTPMPAAAPAPMDDGATNVYRLQTPMPGTAPAPIDDGATNVYRLQTPAPSDPDVASAATSVFKAPAARSALAAAALPADDTTTKVEDGGPGQGAAMDPLAALMHPDGMATSVSRTPLPAAGGDGDSATVPELAPIAIAAVAAKVAQPANVEIAAQTPGAPAPKKKGGIIGRVLGGRFEVNTYLGSGGFGATYVALDQRLRRECVVKMLRPMSPNPTPFEQEMRKRFANEAVTLAHLVHPNVTQIFDYGEEPDGTSWIAMELVEGKTLAAIGKADRELESSRVATLGSQIAAALAFAHTRGIVHRDLKPDNIIVVESANLGEQVKVLDFGIARITDAGRVGLEKDDAKLTAIGAFLGTPAFMSPEQAEGAEVGPSSDVYSLGVMLYLLVTGTLPGNVPSAWNPMTTAVYVASPFKPVRELRAECHPILAELIEQMLVKDPEKRVITAQQIQNELALLQPTVFQPVPGLRRREGHPAFREEPEAPREDKSTQKLLIILVLVMSVVAVLAVGALLATMFRSGSSEAPEPPAHAPATPPAPAPVPAPAAATPPAPVVPNAVELAAQLDAAMRALVLDAYKGAKSVDIEAQAKALQEKFGKDARLPLARAIARLAEKDYNGTLELAQQARAIPGVSEGVLKQIADLEAEATKEKAKAAPPKPKVKPKPTERDEY